MDKEQKAIEEFMVSSGQNVRTKPTPKITDDEKLLRIKLISSELNELIDAMSFNDMVEIADALVDLIYVVKGTANVYGLDLEPLFEEVHRSNMSKLVDGKVIKDASGKIMKPKSYSPPDLKSILDFNLNYTSSKDCNSCSNIFCLVRGKPEGKDCDFKSKSF